MKVTAPTDIHTKWFYVAVLPERDAWTPRAVFNRAGIGVSYV